MSKKRYAVGFYNGSERRDDPEWTDNKCNRLVNYIYDNQELFNIRYKNIDKNTNLLTVRATIKADIANNTNSIHAKCIDILPEAIGLNFFTG